MATVNKKPTSKSKPKAKQTPRPEHTDDVTNEVNINVRNPVPLELENQFGYSGGGSKYIPFLTSTDDYFYGWDTFFNTLLDLRLQSSTLDDVLDSKTDFTIGDGVYVEGIDRLKTDKTWQSFLKICNSEPEGLNSVLRSIIVNFLTFGNSPIEIVRGETGGKRWLHVYSKNQLDCRKSWPDGNNESQAMIISRWFRKRGYMNLTQKFNIRIPFYKAGEGSKDDFWIEDTTDNQGVKTGKKVFRTALWLRNKYPGYDHYGLPSWIASMINAELEYAGSVYNHDNLKNGMNIGGLLTLEGNVDTTEEKKIGRDLNKTFSGKGRGGRTMVVSSPSGIAKSDWKPFNTHKDGSYIDLDMNSVNKIIMANKWDGAFIGKTDGMSKSKSGAYLNELYQQKIKTVIKPLHRIIKDSFFVPLQEIADEWLGTKWSDYDLGIQVANLFADTTEASTTVNGLIALENIIKLVGSGILPEENAINLVSIRFGMEKQVAETFLKGIKIVAKPTLVRENE